MEFKIRGADYRIRLVWAAERKYCWHPAAALEKRIAPSAWIRLALVKCKDENLMRYRNRLCELAGLEG